MVSIMIHALYCVHHHTYNFMMDFMHAKSFVLSWYLAEWRELCCWLVATSC